MNSAIKNMLISFSLTLILLEPKVISVCQQYRARPACTSVQSDLVLYRWMSNFQASSFLNIPKMIKDSSSKNGRWIIPFKRFGRLRVKDVCNVGNTWPCDHVTTYLLKVSWCDNETVRHIGRYTQQRAYCDQPADNLWPRGKNIGIKGQPLICEYWQYEEYLNTHKIFKWIVNH